MFQIQFIVSNFKFIHLTYVVVVLPHLLGSLENPPKTRVIDETLLKKGVFLDLPWWGLLNIIGFLVNTLGGFSMKPLKYNKIMVESLGGF